MGTLVKPTQEVFVPAVQEQQELPASHDCYPPPPDPPTTPPGGGGGNGSGPPGGDCYLAPVYQQVVTCGGYPYGDPNATYPCTTQMVLIGYVQVCP